MLPVQDLGLAIAVLTIAVRLALIPFIGRSQRAQRELHSLQPEIKKIQEQYKTNREGQARALMDLYGKKKINPFSGCLFLLIQLPFFIAFFHVLQSIGQGGDLGSLYSFVSPPDYINPVSFGILDLTKGNLPFGVIAALTQYFQAKLSSASTPPLPSSGSADMAKMLQWQTLYFFPVLVLVWSATLPSALTLYWTVLNIFGILQEKISRRRSLTQ
jgi:YidC/Oxa1 family membrane protein insertase